MTGLIPERDERGQVSLSDTLGFKQRPVTGQCDTHGAFETLEMVIGGRIVVGYCPGCAEASKQAEIARSMGELQAHRAEARRMRIEARVATAGIPARFKACTFDSYRVDEAGLHAPAQTRALKVARAFADRWDSVLAKGQVLILTGSPGTGKTHLACAIANDLMRRHEASVAFGTVADHMRGVKASFQKDSGTSERSALRALIEPDLLIIDELGQRTTEYDQQTMFDLLNGRYSEMRPMVLMTNLSSTELDEHLGERMADRLREVGVFVSMKWDSFRRQD